jgi:hypothetical protein
MITEAKSKWDVELEALLNSYKILPFEPLAYFDKHLDCIRVQIKDCSFTEERVNSFFTLWYMNHVETRECIGFTIKGVVYISEKMGLPKSLPISIADFLDTIVKYYHKNNTNIKQKVLEISAIDETVAQLKQLFPEVVLKSPIMDFSVTA